MPRAIDLGPVRSPFTCDVPVEVFLRGRATRQPGNQAAETADTQVTQVAEHESIATASQSERTGPSARGQGPR